MIDLTGIVRPYFKRQASRSSAAHLDETTPVKVLRTLVRKASATSYGQAHGFDRMMVLSGRELYDAFHDSVPVVAYEELAPWIMRMVKGEKNVLWPGRCDRFAQSSGTSDGRSKYIPVTDDSLKVNHYAGASQVVANYLSLYPDSHLFRGKAFILGGSFANTIDGLRPGARVGDLSANLIDAISPFANFYRVPSKRLALMEDWNIKLPALARMAVKSNITNISGVPSWFLAVLKEALKITGADNIHQIWPGLEVFFHGGIAFGPYREEYAAITDTSKMRYLETYNASEGFFAVQTDREDKSMELLTDVGVFYEFVPLEEGEGGSVRPRAPWEVEKGRTYSLLVTSCNGLWRYAIGDTVTVTSTSPLKIVIAGRTKHFINAFGEELMVHNADKAIALACSLHNAAVSDYTAGPVYPCGDRKGRHQWAIEWLRAPDDEAAFMRDLDRTLCEVNSDYAAKRTGGLFLDAPELTVVAPGTFNRWLASTGKLGGQRKVPRLYNSRRFIDAIVGMSDTAVMNGKRQ